MTKQQMQLDVAKPYEPTPEETVILDANRVRCRAKPPVPAIKVVKQELDRERRTQHVRLELDHPDPDTASIMIQEGFATANWKFADAIITQLSNATMTHEGQPSEYGLNAAIATVRAIDPQDEVETLLASQMAVIHATTMDHAFRLAQCQNAERREAIERALNRLTRTFCAQVEALKRYRTGGEQTVTVQHVSVSDGGQAIVGNVTHGGGGKSKKPEPTS